MNDSKQLTKFGTVVYGLMSEKGITRQVDLANRMRDENGKTVPSHRLSPWLRGVNAPPRWLCRSISEALELDQDQDVRLAVAFAFGSDVKVSGLN